MDGNVIQDMRERDTENGGDDEDEIHLSSGLEWSANLAEDECKREQNGRGDETDNSEASDRTQFGRGTFYQHTIKRPAEGRDHRDGQSRQRNMSIRRAWLEPDYTESADQSHD